MIRRATAAVLLAAGLLALGGCATRRERLGLDAEAAARPRTTARPGESGYASFGSAVRLRSDTPSLTAVEEEEARRREPVYVEAPPWAQAPAGPAGDPGVSSWYDPWAAANSWGVVAPVYGGPGYGGPGYAGPGGAVPPGLRSPNPLTAPYHRAFPSGDVTFHRPGLSTGTGIYGRDAADAARGGAR